jgi:hypothetical protein
MTLDSLKVAVKIPDDKTMTQKECFQIAKLALFNVKLLNELENIGHEDLKNLIKEVHEKLSLEEKPALINQSTYLQFAYVTLVWLWESINIKDKDDFFIKLKARATKRELALPDASQISGERVISDWKMLVSLIRNALSQGSIEITEDAFIFSDQKKFGKRKEIVPTTLTMSAIQLAAISETVFWTLNEIIAPSSK